MSICQLAPCELEWKMWRRAVLVVLFLVHISSTQPVTNEVETARQTRQLDFGGCCPCSDSNIPSFRAQEHWLGPQNAKILAVPSENVNRDQSLNNNGVGFPRSSLNDCPCRLRGADSEGSSSIFFPSALRPNDPFHKSESKEDPKNLLEPEVGFASSVLETLQKATDEEYRDALARDAARARVADDATPEESAPNIVTIILPTPDEEDIISESHVQEPRCIRPLGSTLSRMRTPVKKPPTVMTEIFMLPKTKPVGLLHRSNLDMDSGVGASNVQERVLDTNGRNRKLKTNQVQLQSGESNVCESHLSKSPTMKSASLSEMQQESPVQDDVLKSSDRPKYKWEARLRDICNTHNNDMKSSASDTKEFFEDPRLRIGSLTSENGPLNLKKILKLRDVELVPPGKLIEKLKLNSPTLQLPPLMENMPKLSDLLKNGIKFNFNKSGQWNNAKDGDDSIEDGASNSNIQVIPRDKILTTDILDALPSTSNNIEVKDSCDFEPETTTRRRQSETFVKYIKTEDIKSVPRSSDATKGTDQDVTDDSLGNNFKDIESVSHLLRDTNDDKVSNELILPGSDNVLPTLNILSEEHISPNEKSVGIDHELGASNCIESIQNVQKSSENNDELSPEKNSLFHFNINSQNLDEHKANIQAKETKAINNDGSSNKILSNQNESILGKSLASFRKDILRRIEDRERTSKISKEDVLRESNGRKDIQRSNIKQSKQDCQDEAIQNLSELPNVLSTVSKIIKAPEASDSVQFEDLQILSDNLLKKSLLADTSMSDSRELLSDSDTASNNKFTTELENKPNHNIIQHTNADIGTDITGEEENECTRPISLEDTAKSLRSGPEVNEMTAEASEPVIGAQWHDPLNLLRDTRVGSPLFQNIIVEPSSLFEGIRNAPNLDLSGALNLPTLDDIRERLANVFGTHSKDSIDENDDCMNENPVMAAEPSTSNFRSKSPVSPLEDLNLDIFQLKPLTMGKSSTLSKTPGLNLKSFKTKVPVPKYLDLKPLRLQSTVGNDGGLLGATLTLGRNTIDTPKLFENLGDSLQNLPNLDEMIMRMRSNVENLVTPLDFSRDPNSLPSISDFSDNLRSNAENTLRALKQRMGSSGPQNNLLSNSHGNPHELLERIANAKEDLDAKLNGLHYDLNDRLTSMHENILDQSFLQSLNPLFEGNSLKRNDFNNYQNTGYKTMPTSESKKLKKERMGKTANFKNKLTGQPKTNGPVQRKFKMPAAASVPVPKTVEVPKLKSTLEKYLSSPENDSKMKALASRTNFKPSKLLKEPSLLSKQASSLKENKVKVTFGSPTPVPMLRSQQATNSNLDGRMSEDLRKFDSGLGRRLGLKQKSSFDPNESPSEVQPTILRSMSQTASKNCNEEIDSLEDAKDKTSLLGNQRNTMRATPKQNDSLKSKSAVTDSGSGTKIMPLSRNPLPSWPKDADNSFLSKVRDAIKARLSNFDPTKSIDNEQENAKTCSDMERSASENTDVVLGDSLKENVSYKCRMVCTKS